jgi:TonB family protein
LGVRSVLVFPLVRNGELTGLLEVFSAQAAAFGKRDELVLEALGQRVLKNLERAREISLPKVVEDREQDADLGAEVQSDVREISMMGLDMKRSDEDEVFAENLAIQPRTRFNVVTFALTAAIVVCAVLLATVVGMRVMARRSAGARERVQTVAQVGEPSTDAPTGNESSGEIPAAVPLAADNVAASEKKSPSAIETTSNAAEDSPLPDGSLRVYDNGKEVFRLPVNGRAEAPAGRSGVQRASAVEAIPPEAGGRVLHRVEPEYPEQARQQKIQGSVVLDVQIGRDGAVQDVKRVSGQQVLADAAMAAVKQWRFKPRVEQGQAVEMQARVTLNFRMPS